MDWREQSSMETRAPPTRYIPAFVSILASGRVARCWEVYHRVEETLDVAAECGVYSVKAGTIVSSSSNERASTYDLHSNGISPDGLSSTTCSLSTTQGTYRETRNREERALLHHSHLLQTRNRRNKY